jgi:hypothetical protein
LLRLHFIIFYLFLFLMIIQLYFHRILTNPHTFNYFLLFMIILLEAEFEISIINPQYNWLIKILKKLNSLIICKIYDLHLYLLKIISIFNLCQFKDPNFTVCF